MKSINLSHEKILSISETIVEISKLEFDDSLYAKNDEDAKKKWQRFIYAITVNEDIFITHAKALKKATAPSKEYKKYIQERSNLGKKYSQKDKNNNPKINQGNFIIEQKYFNDFTNELDELKNKYSDAIEKQNKIIEDINEFMEEEDQINIKEVFTDSIPLTLNMKQMKVLLPLMDKEIV